MKTLVLNAGSSSLKYQLFDMENEKLLAKGNCEKIGLKDSVVSLKANGEVKTFEGELQNHEQALKKVFEILCAKENKLLGSLKEIEAVGHRVLHGGEKFTTSVVVNDEILEGLKELIPLGPLHQPANIQGIEACISLMPGVPQVAVFDTEFHTTMPDYAFRYAVPKEAYTKWAVRK